MEPDTAPNTPTPVAHEDGNDGLHYPWDDWATESRARLLLADALGACVPNESGEVVADMDALGRLEAEHNMGLARVLMAAAERLSRADRAYDMIQMKFGDDEMYGARHGAGLAYSRTYGWTWYDAAEKIERELLLPNSAARVHYVPRSQPRPTSPDHVAPLPPGPHKGCGWFDAIVAALVQPESGTEHGARPLDAPLCTTSIALVQALVSLGDQRTAPLHVVDCGWDDDGVQITHQRPPTDCGKWSTTRFGLGVFVSLMKRIHATWSLYLPLVAPTEHAINCALMPDIVE